MFINKSKSIKFFLIEANSVDFLEKIEFKLHLNPSQLL